MYLRALERGCDAEEEDVEEEDEDKDGWCREPKVQQMSAAV